MDDGQLHFLCSCQLKIQKLTLAKHRHNLDKSRTAETPEIEHVFTWRLLAALSPLSSGQTRVSEFLTFLMNENRLCPDLDQFCFTLVWEINFQKQNPEQDLEEINHHTDLGLWIPPQAHVCTKGQKHSDSHFCPWMCSFVCSMSTNENAIYFCSKNSCEAGLFSPVSHVQFGQRAWKCLLCIGFLFFRRGLVASNAKTLPFAKTAAMPVVTPFQPFLFGCGWGGGSSMRVSIERR